MHVGFLVSFPTKGTSLYHRDQCRLELEVCISIVDNGTYGHVSKRWSGELTNSLVGHDIVDKLSTKLDRLQRGYVEEGQNEMKPFFI